MLTLLKIWWLKYSLRAVSKRAEFADTMADQYATDAAKHQKQAMLLRSELRTLMEKSK